MSDGKSELIDRCAEIAEARALGWINGEAGTVYGAGFQAGCRAAAEAVRALRPASEREEVKPIAWRLAWRRIRSDGTPVYWEVEVPDSTPLYATPAMKAVEEELAEWKQAASVEAGLRREFLARAETAESSLASARKALEPFSKAADNYADCKDSIYLDEDATVTVGDLREARAALTK